MALHELSQKKLESELKAAQASGGIRKISDGEGLYLMVRRNGGASWQLQYSFAGKQKTYSFGTYPKLSLSVVRGLAKDVREDIARGIDPVEKRREARSPVEVKIKNVGALIQEWLDLHRLKWSATHYDDFDKAAKSNVLPHIGAKDINLVTPEDIRTLLRKIEERQANYMLTRVRSLLERAFEHALDTDQIAANPVHRVKRRSFEAHSENHHPARIDPREFGVLLQKLDNDVQTLPVLALRLNALVFVRPQNLRSGQWSDVDLENRVWTIPFEQMKKERAFLVPLARQAVELLTNLKTITGHQELLFPSPRGGSYGDTTFMKNLHRLGYKGLHSTHGFRTSAKTLLEEGGYESKYVEKQLAHEIENKVDRAYNRAEYWPQRVEMMQAWADYLDALRKDPQQPWAWFADWRARQSTE